MKSENFDLAKQMFERAEDAGVVLPDHVNDYGICQALTGHPNEARRAFERVLEMDPQNELAQLNVSKLRSIDTAATRRVLLQELRVLANQTFVQKTEGLEFDGKMLEALSWRPPIVSAMEFTLAR